MVGETIETFHHKIQFLKGMCIFYVGRTIFANDRSIYNYNAVNLIFFN